jgi:pimeloyl-ACP methyl ester carboxylesterase
LRELILSLPNILVSGQARDLHLLRGQLVERLDPALAHRLARGQQLATRIGDAALRASFNVAAGASPYACYACVDTWLTDFRGDLPKIDVPTLVVPGTADRILPFEATAARLRDENLIADLTVVEVENGPHNIGWTHPAETNAAILGFLSGEAKADTAPAAASA